jgi:hypothetical protein
MFVRCAPRVYLCSIDVVEAVKIIQKEEEINLTIALWKCRLLCTYFSMPTFLYKLDRLLVICLRAAEWDATSSRLG